MDKLTMKDILSIIDKVDASGLVEFKMTADGVDLVLKKAGAVAAMAADAAPKVTATPKAPAATPPPTASVPTAEATDDSITEVSSPVLGTFYRAPEPGAEPYTTVGAHVEAGQVLGIVEVMKLFNEVKSPVAGEIIDIVADDSEMVEYGQPLLHIRCA